MSYKTNLLLTLVLSTMAAAPLSAQDKKDWIKPAEANKGAAAIVERTRLYSSYLDTPIEIPNVGGQRDIACQIIWLFTSYCR